VVNEGTGKKAKLKKWQVFGKTGTANIAKTAKGLRRASVHRIVYRGAPAEDRRCWCLSRCANPICRWARVTRAAQSPLRRGKILEKTLTYLENNRPAIIPNTRLATN